MRKINWTLIRTLPADAAIVTGGPEYGCFRCAHVPAKRHNVEMLLAETGEGLVRRLLEPRKGQPSKYGQAHLIAGRLEDFRVPTCEESPLRPLDLEVPGCPVVGIHVNGAIDSNDTVQAPKRTREEAAKMVMRSMVADMRRQGWSLSNEAADQMVAKLSAEILALPATLESE